jgi:peptide/nickel transport system ATP-binding protein
MGMESVIEARDLRKWYPVRDGLLASLRERRFVKAVDGVSLSIAPAEVLGLAGESGSGKSTTGMTLLKLHPPTGGEIRFQGLGLLANESRRRRLAFRRQAQIVFQNPYESLNPRYTVAQSVNEPPSIHFPGERDKQRTMLLRAMEQVGLMPAASYLDRYPHQLSGGQLQRVAIARAISVEPKFLVADEPVSMLDVSIRAGILNLLRHFATEMRMATLYISHDLSTMRHICSTIAVMYLGRIIESGAGGCDAGSTAASLCAGFGSSGAGDGWQPAPGAGAVGRPAARCDRSSGWMPVSSAVSDGDGCLPAAGAVPAGNQGGSACCLPPA